MIVMLLFGAAVFEFNSINRGASLSEGTDRLKSLFRFASNESQRTGRLVRIRFGLYDVNTSTNTIQTDALSEQQLPIVEWEPFPIKFPGQFKLLPNSKNYANDIDELVSIDKRLKKGQIYDSNRYLLRGLLEKLPVTIKDAGAVTDNENKIIKIPNSNQCY